MSVERVRICDLIVSADVMPRRAVDWDVCLDYSDAYQAGEPLPPVVAFADDDQPGRYWLADGWHRIGAQGAYGDDDVLLDPKDDPTEIEADVRPGGQLAAMLCAASANTTHGRRRDRRDAVAAATVAIRALLRQDPDRRPTVEAVKATARVGTDTAQRAFRELEEADARQRAAEAPPLPAKDPRGGARVRDFVPRGTNPGAYPEVDANGMLPIVELGGSAVEPPTPATPAPAARVRPAKITVPLDPETMAGVIRQYLDDSEMNALIVALGRFFS